MVRKTEAFIKDLLANADVELNGERPWDMQVHDPSLYDAVCRQGSLGLGEAYMAGLWDMLIPSTRKTKSARPPL